jgi:hypothetical protein
MKKLLFLIVSVALCGCASTHVKHSVSPAPAPVVAVAPVDHTVERAVVHPPQVAPANSPAKVATKPAPIMVVEKSVESSIKPASKTSVLVAYFKWLIVTVLTALLSWASYKYLVPLVKKGLTWIKSKNVVSDLKTLATEAQAKIEVDFKDIVTDVEHTSQVLPPSTPAHPTTVKK